MELREYQRRCVDQTWQWLCTNPGNPVMVSPTGSGKSILLAELARITVQKFNGRSLILANRKELIEQNADKVRKLIPEIEVGLFSAGLRRWQAESPVVVAGIQSCYKKAEAFGKVNLLQIDEVHLVNSDDGMYKKFIDDLRSINPRMRVVGLTATPYRLSEGSICRQDGIFQAVSCEIKIPELIRDGYLCPVTNAAVETKFNTDHLHVRGGEFVPAEVEALYDADDRKVLAACQEICQKTIDRRSILVFASSVKHADHVSRVLAEVASEEVGVVTGETPDLERSALLNRFQSGSLRFLVNVAVLTTGFDSPTIDAIVLLRATQSPGLLYQMVGRGFRIHPSKKDCLVLDYGSHFARFGPLDSEDYDKVKKKRPELAGDAPVKECPNCGEIVAASARTCICGLDFPKPQLKHETQADHEATILAALAKPSYWIVEEIKMERWKSKKSTADQPKPDTLCVTYTCQPAGEEKGNLTSQPIREWICLEHDGWARKNAMKWWKVRSLAPIRDIDDALEMWERGAVASAHHIWTIKDGRYDRITKHELDEVPESWHEGDLAEAEVGWEAMPREDEELPF